MRAPSTTNEGFGKATLEVSISETIPDATPMVVEAVKTAVGKFINDIPTKPIPPEHEPSSRETLDKKMEEVSNADMVGGPIVTNESTLDDKADDTLRITHLETGGGLDTNTIEEIADLSEPTPILTLWQKLEPELPEPEELGNYAQNLTFEIVRGTGIKAKVDGSAIEEVQGGKKNEPEPEIANSCLIETKATDVEGSKDEPTDEATVEHKMAAIVLEDKNGDGEGCRSFESEAPPVEFQERIRRPYGSR